MIFPRASARSSARCISAAWVIVETNENLSRRDAEIERLTAESIASAKQIPPTTGPVETFDGR